MGVDAGALSAHETTEIDVDASWPRAYCLRICMYTKHPRLKYLADRARDDGD